MSKPPQTEAAERDAVMFELGVLAGSISRLTGTLPALVTALPFADDRIDFAAMPTEHIADLCAELRAEYLALGGLLDG